MPPFGNKVGVIILGNSGVGKSFLANVILGNEIFTHAYQIDAVTLKTEYMEATFDGQTYAIYNIPGLIEAEQERIDVNIREINIAFQQHPNAVVLFVFGTVNGKIRNEDVVAFNAINAAYPLSEKSLVVIVNNVKPDRPDNYDKDAETKLGHLLKMRLPHICFVNQIINNNEKAPIRIQLVRSITDAIPKIHNKEQEINLKAVEVSKLVKQVDELQKRIEMQHVKHQQEMKDAMEKQRQEIAAHGLRMRTEQYESDRQRKADEEARERNLRAEIGVLQTRLEQQLSFQTATSSSSSSGHRHQHSKEEKLKRTQRKLYDKQREQSKELKKLQESQKRLNEKLKNKQTKK